MNHYGCHNQPRPTPATSYIGQAGWRDMRDQFGAPVRSPVFVDIPHQLSTDCRFDRSASDVKCSGCEHAKGGGQ
jgi:hypothetical protein